MLTLYKILALAPAWKPYCWYQIGLQFTHKNGVFSVQFLLQRRKMRRADLENGAFRIVQVLCHTIMQCEQVSEPYRKWISSSEVCNPLSRKYKFKSEDWGLVHQNPLGQPLWHEVEVQFVWTTCSSFVPLLFMLYWVAIRYIVNTA